MHQEDGGLFHPNAYSDVSGQFKRPWICCVNSVRWSFPRGKKKMLKAQSSEDAGIEKCSAMHTFKWTKVLQCHFDQTWELSYGHSPGLPPLSVGPTWRLIKYQSFQQKYTLTESPGATAYCLKWNVKKEEGKSKRKTDHKWEQANWITAVRAAEKKLSREVWQDACATFWTLCTKCKVSM